MPVSLPRPSPGAVATIALCPPLLPASSCFRLAANFGCGDGPCLSACSLVGLVTFWALGTSVKMLFLTMLSLHARTAELPVRLVGLADGLGIILLEDKDSRLCVIVLAVVLNLTWTHKVQPSVGPQPNTRLCPMTMSMQFSE